MSTQDDQDSILFEMQISGFFNDLPPLEGDDSECGRGGSLLDKQMSRVGERGSEGWGLLNMLGMGTNTAKRDEPLLAPIWTLR